MIEEDLTQRRRGRGGKKEIMYIYKCRDKKQPILTGETK